MSGRSRKEVPSWREPLVDYIRSRGGRVTAPRLRVAEVFFGLQGHPGVEEVVQAVQRRWPQIGQATVYRTLHLLVDSGLVEARQFGDRFSRYEAVGSEHHDHLVCDCCGAIREFEDPGIEEAQRRIADAFGFRMTGHRMEIHGCCARCVARQTRPRSGA
ncbi:MAG TPA: Fur family transcriptional regulator [Myxococcota bacterium]|nr:Fur family transcriptional regulator [Myxococcota bacterium]HQK50815.1 Fur family transcriptional regulator [Myxococcota bacterium]